MLTFIDDYSRKYWVYPIKKKSDVFPVFKEYKARVELEFGKTIKCLRMMESIQTISLLHIVGKKVFRDSS